MKAQIVEQVAFYCDAKIELSLGRELNFHVFAPLRFWTQNGSKNEAKMEPKRLLRLPRLCSRASIVEGVENGKDGRMERGMEGVEDMEGMEGVEEGHSVGNEDCEARLALPVSPSRLPTPPQSLIEQPIPALAPAAPPSPPAAAASKKEM